MTDFFTPIDFTHAHDEPLLSGDAAFIANAKIENQGAIVYGLQDSDGKWFFSGEKRDSDTHQAIILALKPIEKCQKHWPKKSGAYAIGIETLVWYELVCECGKKLSPKEFEEKL